MAVNVESGTPKDDRAGGGTATKPVATTSGVCAHHRHQPKVAACVACGDPLCTRCIVRTPVGLKCPSCTGSRAVSDAGRRSLRGDRGRGGENRQSRGVPPRRVVVGGVAVAVIALLAVIIYAMNRPSSGFVGNDPVAARVGSTDVRVVFPGPGGVQLVGILSLPPKAFQPSPAVLIVPDYGSVDRDGITRQGNVPDRLYADFAQSLNARGYASLRYDPRGQGQSALPSGSALQLPDLVGDASSGLNLLAGRKEINAKQLSVAGDGWGGLVAMQLVAQDQRATAAVLVSTPGRPVVETVADQLQATAATPADGQKQVQQLRSTVTSLLGGAHLPAPGDLDPALRPILPQSNEAYLKAVFGLDPAGLAKQIRVPTLIVRGSQDPAIAAADVDALMGAIGTQADMLLATGAGHTLAIETPSAPAASAGNSSASNALGALGAPVARDSVSLNSITNWITPPTTPGAPRAPMVPALSGMAGH